jgi:hypothetical protein
MIRLTGKTKIEFTTKFGLAADIKSDLQLKEVRDQFEKDIEEMKTIFGF